MHYELDRGHALLLGGRPSFFIFSPVESCVKRLVTEGLFHSPHACSTARSTAAADRGPDLLRLENSSTDRRTLPGDSLRVHAESADGDLLLFGGDSSFSLTSRTKPGDVMDSTSRTRLPHKEGAVLPTPAPCPNVSKKATRAATVPFAISSMTLEFRSSRGRS